MVLVNDAGGPVSYPQLQHAKWHGWTLTDTVFPSFLWIVGVSLTLSLGKRMAAGVPRGRLWRQMLRRSAILFALGLLIYLYPHFAFSTMRIPGVLQRIAICFLAAGSIYLVTGVRGQIAAIVGLLLFYWVLMTFAPVPGYGAGRLDFEGNFARFVDSLVFGRHNYQSGNWDPEGLVSTIPAIASTLFGVLAGHILRWKEPLRRRVVVLLGTGVALLVAGLLLHPVMPINKKLWTDSFCLFMAGLDFVVFAIFAALIDGRQFRLPVNPLVILGMNAIAVYMLSELLAETLDALDVHEWLYAHVFAPIASPPTASLLYAIAFVALMYGFAYALYRRRWFWRI